MRNSKIVPFGDGTSAVIYEMTVGEIRSMLNELSKSVDKGATDTEAVKQKMRKPKEQPVLETRLDTVIQLLLGDMDMGVWKHLSQSITLPQSRSFENLYPSELQALWEGAVELYPLLKPIQKMIDTFMTIPITTLLQSKR